MMPHPDSHGNSRPIGQPAALALILFCLLGGACHPLPAPGEGDPRLPLAFRTPEKTFTTWVQATLAGDREALRACYWEGLGEEELRAYLSQNLSREARRYFQDAELTGIRPVSRVEVNFTFRSPEETEEIRGVMVRTRWGWKIQHW